MRSAIRSGGEKLRNVRDTQFQAERFLTRRTRNGAAYRGLCAPVMKCGGRDFHTREMIDTKAYMADSIRRGSDNK